MTKAEMEHQVRTVARVRRLSRHTEDCYLGWLRRFAAFVAQHPSAAREERVRLFLEHLAPRSAASTQNQALNAIVFFYRDVLRQPLHDLGKWARAQRPKRLPVWLSSSEMDRLLEQMSGTARLMAEMAYGSGLRLAELLALRIKDIDLDSATITVRGGKGDKDRVTCLPRSLAFRLGPHLRRVRAQWESDRARNAAPIHIPDGLERKFPRPPRRPAHPPRRVTKSPLGAAFAGHSLPRRRLGRFNHAASSSRIKADTPGKSRV